MMSAKKWTLLAAGMLMLTGCGTERLETGYVPQKLGDSDAVRRSYYAAPFTRESRVSKLDGGDDRMETRPQRSY
jgi:hypothetical protein